MFGSEIHWTTFFYLLIDSFIVLFTLYITRRKTRESLIRFLYLGFLFIAYNVSGGFLPMDSFPGPILIQYIITYGVAIALCIYIIYYLYMEYDIVVLKFNSSIKNLAIFVCGCYVVLFLLPYFFTNSLHIARIFFTIPIAIAALGFLILFYHRIATANGKNNYILRRNRLSMISVSSIALLPICTVLGDYQYITFTVMNLAFYSITAMEVDRYIYFIENKARLLEIFNFNLGDFEESEVSPLVHEQLTRREMEIAVSILKNYSYKRIAEDLYIAKSTVYKHASNIFAKTKTKNRQDFIIRFKEKK